MESFDLIQQLWINCDELTEKQETTRPNGFLPSIDRYLFLSPQIVCFGSLSAHNRRFSRQLIYEGCDTEEEEKLTLFYDSLSTKKSQKEEKGEEEEERTVGCLCLKWSLVFLGLYVGGC